MPRPTIPPDPKGYMLVAGEIHTRYATHCPRGQRYRTVDDVFGAVARALYSVCGTCYPAAAGPKPRTRSRAPRRRAEKGRS